MFCTMKEYLKISISVFILFLVLISCSQNKVNTTSKEIESLDQIITQWHKAAAEANFEEYFDKMEDDFVFIGTDAQERWNKKDFAIYSKPHFDRGKSWEFKTLNRHIYASQTNEIAWFDEILDTSFKICRGSGVLKKNEVGDWKFMQYVLSMTIPNEKAKEVVALKDSIEIRTILKIQNK